MFLKLKPSHKNVHPLRGILIKGSSPLTWLKAMDEFQLNLSAAQCYPIPGIKANEIYGCLVVISSSDLQSIKQFNQHVCVQLVENRLFIPAFSTISPLLSAEEIETVFNRCLHFLHPELGLVELNDPIDWRMILQPYRSITIAIEQPHSGVFIPKNIQSFRLEMDANKLLMEIEKPLTEEEKLAKLPFNLKKLMAGNEREMEKFMAFMEKNPELAMKYALPLDTLGTGRGSLMGEFNFGGGFMQSFMGFFGVKKTSGSGISSYFKGFLKIFWSLFFTGILLYFLFSLVDGASSREIGSSPTVSSNFWNVVILVVFCCTLVGLFIKLFLNSTFSISGTAKPFSRVAMVVILFVVLFYLLMPIYSLYGFTKWYVLGTLVIIGILMYRLFHADKDIFGDE